MSLNVRSYLNSDSQSCCEIWNAHFQQSGLAVDISRAMWELCVVDKIFFHYDHFIVVERADRPLGFAHLTYGPQTDWGAIDCEKPILNAMCIRPDEEEDLVASLLLTAVEQQAGVSAKGVLRALGGPDWFCQYLLVPPTHGMIGVLASDQRLQRWLSNAGYQPYQPTDRWRADLNMLKLPMDRGQMTVRRTSSVSRILTESCDLWFAANAFGHAEQMRFSLVTKGHEATNQEIVYLYLDPAYFPVDRATAMLLLPEIPTDQTAVDQLTFLLAESLRQLQFERFSSAFAITAANNIAATTMLQRLSFRSVASGAVYQKQF